MGCKYRTLTLELIWIGNCCRAQEQNYGGHADGAKKLVQAQGQSFLKYEADAHATNPGLRARVRACVCVCVRARAFHVCSLCMSCMFHIIMRLALASSRRLKCVYAFVGVRVLSYMVLGAFFKPSP